MTDTIENSNPKDITAPQSEVAARDLLTVEQAAAFLHMSPSSIRAYIRQGNLKAFRIAGKRKVLIARQSLMNLLQPT